jgi:uncharacterized protein (TIGR02453 family)
MASAVPVPASFTGFPPEALKFLRQLKRNNRREWFQPRKHIFESALKAPMVALVEEVNAGLRTIAPDYRNDPAKAIYRFYRDTRFSSDKTPYKDHIAALFPRRGHDRHSGAAFYFGVSAEGVEVAGGVYMPGPEQLLAIRMWLAENHASFVKASRLTAKTMGEINGSSLQRIPKGFSADHPAADLLKRKQWYFGKTLDVDAVTSPKLPAEILKLFRSMTPVVELLNTPLNPRRAKESFFDLIG